MVITDIIRLGFNLLHLLDLMQLDSSNLLGRSSGSLRRPAVSSSRDAITGSESAEPSRPRTSEASLGMFRKVAGAQRSSPAGSSEPPKPISSGRNISNIKNYESTLKGIQGLSFGNDERERVQY